MKFRWETEFKETEIGGIPKDWGIRRVEEVADVSTGGTPSRKKKEYWGGGIKWVKSQEVRNQFIWETEETITKKAMKNSNAKRIYLPNTVLVALYGATAGEISLLKISATINQAIAALEGNKVDNLFLFYSMLGNKNRLKELAIGSAQQNLYLKDVREFEIPIPPTKEEQTRIATVLSWFDDLIENKKKQNEILEKMAMAIFKSWFIDFEPFQDEGFVYSEELDMEIPEGWEAGGLSDIAEVIMGQSPPSKYYNNKGEGIPFIQGKGQFGEYTPQTETYTTQISKLAKSLDILVTVRAPIGELNIADTEYVIGRGVAALRSKFWTFLYTYLKTYNEVLKSFERGTTFDAITKPELESIMILLPPQPILQRFQLLVEPLFHKILLNQKEILTLKKIRDTLLPQLVFGRLRVEEL